MKLSAVSFTEHGSRLNRTLMDMLSRQGIDCCGYAVPKYAKTYGLLELQEPLRDWTGRMFEEADAILFLSAAGIAVRSIAPFVEDKTKDPAVVVMDERGVFAVSLLSGHLGGANELAGMLANLTEAIPVITTATDVNGRFAVDLFAKKNGLYITDMACAKQISADVLDEKKIGFCSDFPVVGEIPQELEPWEERAVFEGSGGICVTLDENKRPYKSTLVLIPRIVSVGVGCKKGIPAERIREKVLDALQKCGVSLHALECVASIDRKAQEPGILEFAKSLGLPFVTFSSGELRCVPGDFEASAFVESVAGVDNVCGRSAVLASQNGRLILKKTAGDGVTVALAARDWSVDFA